MDTKPKMFKFEEWGDLGSGQIRDRHSDVLCDISAVWLTVCGPDLVTNISKTNMKLMYNGIIEPTVNWDKH